MEHYGIGMSVGFTKAEENFKGKEFSNVNDVFKTVGMSMISSMGGASGVIFGTMFVGGVKKLEVKETLNLQLLAESLEGALEAIKQRGKAEVGDKTMIDALTACCLPALKESVEKNFSLVEGLRKAEEGAHQGVENTKKLCGKIWSG